MTGNTKGAKLTWPQVRAIREKAAMGYTQGQLAREFRMGTAQIGRIVRHECWFEQESSPRAGVVSGEVPVPTAMLEGLVKEQEMRKQTGLDVPKPSGVEMALQAVRERAGGFGQAVDFDEPGREMAPGDYGNPTGRRAG